MRELENFIGRTVILTRRTELNVPIAELKDRIGAHGSSSVSIFHSASTFHDAERQASLMRSKLLQARCRRGRRDRTLGLKRTTLQKNAPAQHLSIDWSQVPDKITPTA